MGIRIGSMETRNRVFLAPMSGITDPPFRHAADRRGAGLVVSEMVASEQLVRARPDMLRRALGAETKGPFVIQLAGREPRWMAEGARLAQDLGAAIIDINMGCPAREVTGGLSGSALMRDLDHAVRLVAATVAACSVPVTLKIRLGWDRNSLNAPELARRAEDSGIALITVHGRTRCQFYGGRADWRAIAAVRRATTVPLIANGDCSTLAEARDMLRQSGADGVMIGRGAYGRPWWPGVIAEGLEPGSGLPEPDLNTERDLVLAHHEHILTHYGAEHGNRIARKHLGWTVARLAQRGHLSPEAAAAWRDRLLRTVDNRLVREGLALVYERAADGALAA